MSKLFEPYTIHTLTCKNRFVRAATWEGLATMEGNVTSALVERMATLARGGVGLIISSHAYVSPEGQGTPWQLSVSCDEQMVGLRQMSAAVHAHGAKIFLQLAHAGQFAEETLTGGAPCVVSKPRGTAEQRVKILSHEDIECLVACYANAAKRAQQSGFDGVEIHAAHGYLLSQFLSPAFNWREDQYGGTLENRTRIHRMIYRAIRQTVGSAFPLCIKMNCCDFIDGGLTPEDSLGAARIFAGAGFDALEVSGGIIRTGALSPSRPGINREEKEAYFRDYAHQLKKEITLPVILVGGVRSFEVAENLVMSGVADALAMSRPLIREPDLVKRWQQGDRRKAACISDNLCFTPGFEGRGVSCVTRQKTGGKTPVSRYS